MNFVPTGPGLSQIPVGDLAPGLAGQFIGGTGPGYLFPPGTELNYTQITSQANVTDTSEATASALISPGAITFDGAPVLCEFFSPAVVIPTGAGTNTLIVTLFEGATQITRLAELQSVGALAEIAPLRTTFRFTPTAASHTYKLCAFVSSTTGTPNIGAGAGGTGANAPAFIRFTKV